MIEPEIPKHKKRAKQKPFVVEWLNPYFGNDTWSTWNRYATKGRADRAVKDLSKSHRFQFRVKPDEGRMKANPTPQNSRKERV